MNKIMPFMFAGLVSAFAAVNGNAAEFPTREIKNGTKVTLRIGDTVIPAILNDSKASKELISRLPYTVRLNRYQVDYCGVMAEPLSFDRGDVENGWLNGDLSFTTEGDYFAMFFGGQETSASGGGQAILGRVDVDLSVLRALDRVIEVRIELAQ